MATALYSTLFTASQTGKEVAPMAGSPSGRMAVCMAPRKLESREEKLDAMGWAVVRCSAAAKQRYANGANRLLSINSEETASTGHSRFQHPSLTRTEICSVLRRAITVVATFTS